MSKCTIAIDDYPVGVNRQTDQVINTSPRKQVHALHIAYTPAQLWHDYVLHELIVEQRI